jgi:DUF177 domain-containing protein
MKIHVDEIPELGLEITLSGKRQVLADALAGLPVPAGTTVDPHPKGRLMVLADGDDVFVTGNLVATVTSQCSRCLVQFTSERSLDVSLVFRSGKGYDLREQREDEDLDGETVLVEGPEIDIAEALAQEILLDLPIRALCREDCPGLCPDCGCLRESNDCTCPDREAVDPRWEDLKKLKDLVTR